MTARFLPLLAAALAALAVPARAAPELVLYSAGPASLARNLAAGFEKKTGARIDLYAASTGKVMARLEAEKAHPRADVAILANWTAGLALADENEVQPFDPDDLRNELRPSLNAKGPFVPVGGDTVSIVLNTRTVKNAKSVDDWFALQGASWRNKVTMPDPLLSGTSSDFVLAFTARYGERAWAYFKALKANGTIWPGPNAAALRPVEMGARDAMLAAVGHTALKAQKEGNALAAVFPKSGTLMIPRPILILKSSQQKSLAEQFIRYALSKEGQEMVAKALLIPAAGNVAPAGIWPDLAGVRFIDADWQALATQRTKVLARFRQEILGR